MTGIPVFCGESSITYRVLDVNNYNGVSRATERFIAGSDGSIWYTDSHMEKRKV